MRHLVDSRDARAGRVVRRVGHLNVLFVLVDGR